MKGDIDITRGDGTIEVSIEGFVHPVTGEEVAFYSDDAAFIEGFFGHEFDDDDGIMFLLDSAGAFDEFDFEYIEGESRVAFPDEE